MQTDYKQPHKPLKIELQAYYRGLTAGFILGAIVVLLAPYINPFN